MNPAGIFAQAGAGCRGFGYCPRGAEGFPTQTSFYIGFVMSENEMRLLRWEAFCAILGFVLTRVFILVPGPYPMAGFTFIAQPLFAIAAIGYLSKVIPICEDIEISEHGNGAGSWRRF
jgi:hypothetical protein